MCRHRPKAEATIVKTLVFVDPTKDADLAFEEELLSVIAKSAPRENCIFFETSLESFFFFKFHLKFLSFLFRGEHAGAYSPRSRSASGSNDATPRNAASSG